MWVLVSLPGYNDVWLVLKDDPSHVLSDCCLTLSEQGVVVVVIVWWLNFQISIATNILSLNFAHGKVYLMQHCLIKFFSDLWQIDGFHWVIWFTRLINLQTRYG